VLSEVNGIVKAQLEMLSEIPFSLNLDCTAKEMQTLFSTRLRSEALNAGWLKAVRKCHVS
jgi:hypothetical protein